MTPTMQPLVSRLAARGLNASDYHLELAKRLGLCALLLVATAWAAQLWLATEHTGSHALLRWLGVAVVLAHAPAHQHHHVFLA